MFLKRAEIPVVWLLVALVAAGPAVRAERTLAGARGAASGLAACRGDLLSNGFFDPEHLDSTHNAFVMALLASDAYPATLLPGQTNAKYSAPRYQAAVRARWAALGARTVAFVDDAAEGQEAHALVAATPRAVFVAFRGTSTTEGWGTNVKVTPYRIASGHGGRVLQVHSGFLTSFTSIYAGVALEVAKALEHVVDAPASARVYVVGHSLGGAHALLTALALSDNGATVGGVWAFAAPKVGNQDFVDEYMRRFGDVTFRYVHGLDVVPTLPPNIPGIEPYVQLPADR
ncbi:MAG: Alpha/Beta hydrolase protein [Monoraphidium minutum]|nr:MAG: Alpha/Beta hydrolase protein [Monoraphidium minutum]